MATQPATAPELGAKNVTLNSDIAQMVRRCDRCIYEMQHAQSANVTMTIEADRNRIEKYIKDFNTHADNTKDMGIPDVPETMPEIIALNPMPEDVNVTNDDFYAVIQQFYVIRGEIINSQSSRLGGGLLPPDYTRLKAQIKRIETLFSKFIPEVDPGDNPESTPDIPVVGPGRLGV